MEFVQQFINDKGGEIVSQLAAQLGIDASVVQKFVPAAAEKLLAVVQGGELDLTSLLGGANLSELASKVDAGALAQQVGMQTEQAQQGLTALAPALLDSLGSQAGSAEGVLSMLGGGGEGGLLGGAAKIAGKFFS